MDMNRLTLSVRCALYAAAAIVTDAHAAEIIQQQAFVIASSGQIGPQTGYPNGVVNLFGGGTLTFGPFDSALGTLTAVTFDLASSTYTYADLTIDDSLQGHYARASTVFILNIISTAGGEEIATQGMPNLSGTCFLDGCGLGLPGDFDGPIVVPTSAVPLSAYTDPVDLQLNTLVQAATEGVLGSSAQFKAVFQYTWQGTLTATYTYDPFVAPPPGVPEPAAWATMLAGIGLIGGMLRARRPALRTAA